MLDESLLDTPDALVRADTAGLLHRVASAGARVRSGLRQATEAGLGELRPEGRPRAVFLAGPGPAAACAADLLGTLGNGNAPVTPLTPAGTTAGSEALRWTLPGWAGPLDLLLVATLGGEEPGLVALAEQAYRRGCTVVCVAPPTAPLAAAVSDTRGLAIPLPASLPGVHTEEHGSLWQPVPVSGTEPSPDGWRPPQEPHRTLSEQDAEDAEDGARLPEAAAPGACWTLLTPLLFLADRLGLVNTPPEALHSLADRLDATAERCGPAVEAFSNPAKTLATELSDALPLLWSEDAVAGSAARTAAAALAAVAGRPALTADLPEAMTVQGPLLFGAFAANNDPDDFFRDRVEEPEAAHARIVLLRTQPPHGDSAAPAARDLAQRHGAPLSELEPTTERRPLEAVAELIATCDFTAVYLSLASDA